MISVDEWLELREQDEQPTAGSEVVRALKIINDNLLTTRRGDGYTYLFHPVATQLEIRSIIKALTDNGWIVLWRHSERGDMITIYPFLETADSMYAVVDHLWFWPSGAYDGRIDKKEWAIVDRNVNREIRGVG